MNELFKDHAKVFIRTPLYSYQSLFDDNNGTKNLDDLVLLRLSDPVFMEALYWSSPRLFEAVLKFKEGGVKGAKEKKLLQTLKKYLIRASTRCTPYGIYAGTGIADIGIQHENQKRRMERKVRIDIGLMQNLKSVIESDEAVYPHLFYSINNSLYNIPGQYRFMETIIENGACHYQISSIDQTDFLDQIILLSQNKMVSVNDMYAMADKEILYEEFDCFIKELIKTQFLVSELQLGLTTGNELDRYINILERLIREGISEAEKYLALLLNIKEILIEFETLPIGNLPLNQINDLKALLNECGLSESQQHLFHADLKQSIPLGFTLEKEKLENLKKAIFILGKLTCNTSPQMDRFKKVFYEKYETQEIPLTVALDPEIGIGFPSAEKIGDIAYNSLIEKVDLSLKRNEKISIEDCQVWLQDKIEALDTKSLEKGIELSEEDLKDFDDKIAKLANSFAVMGTLLPSGDILLQSIGGSHANSLLGRFAYLDGKMGEFCKEISDTEKQAELKVIFAEIIHIPEGRIGNIARRPVLSDYEIPFLASSGLESEKQIPASDLLVSVREDEIILRSKRLNKRVIPRLSNAHNYANSLVPVYKFLSSIQHQGKLGLDINWGGFASKKRFLPRLSYRNIILHRACWLLHKRDISLIIKAEDPISKLREFFLKWNVPRFVCFAEGDNELFIDTSSNSYLEILLEGIKTHSFVKLLEWYHTNVIKDDENDKATIQQFILPLSKRTVVHPSPLVEPGISNIPRRTFEPGSEWIYFKIYCGARLSDNVLLNVIKPAIDSLLIEKIITKAFFIRYTDPHYHLRFRLHLSDDANRLKLSSALSCIYHLLHPFISDRLVWKVQLDTYQREIERYGENSILISEKLFFQDSLLYLNCLANEEFREDEQMRFLSALKNMDKWLTVFNMSLQQKADFCTLRSDAFVKEFDSSMKLQLDMKYRELKNLVFPFLGSEKYDSEFTKRDKVLCEMLMPKRNLANYIHMSMNRWFITQQRLMEYMCYLFCNKYYNQIIHQTKTIIAKSSKISKI